ncbi:MAG: carbonic anhydrase family protein [Sphingomonas bacterium]
MHECHDGCDISRRSILTIGAAAGIVGLAGIGIPIEAGAQNWWPNRRDELTPDQILKEIMDGNERFTGNRMRKRDWAKERGNTAAKQYPAAAFLTCIDSRTPVEVLCDLGIGDAFNARVAGNAANDDILGSLEFAIHLEGAKVLMVMGHTNCGAIKGAIDNAWLGNLTLLLARFRNTLEETDYRGDRTSQNPEFVNLVATNHVKATVALIRERSPVIARCEREGKVKITGAMYNLVTGVISPV